MRNPFVYGMEVSGDDFCNRKNEIQELTRDIENGHNVIIFSQRRFGKTSLVRELFRLNHKKGIVTIYVDLYPALCEQDFSQIYAQAVTKSIYTALGKKLKEVGSFFSRVKPYVKIEEDNQIEVKFDINRDNIIPDLEDILESVRKYGERKKKQIAVCFDEFQQIRLFKTDKLEKVLRSHIQRHKNVSYIFMGSKKHLIHDIFNNPNRPFYRSAKSFPLEKIKEEEWIKFISDKFQQTEIKISEKVIKVIIDRCENHPYYVQFLCHILWEKNIDKSAIVEKDVFEAEKVLINRETNTYQASLDGLSVGQRQVLIALAKKSLKDKLLSAEFLRKNNLPSASTVQYIIKSLFEKDLIDKNGKEYIVPDIFFKKWLAALSREV